MSSSRPDPAAVAAWGALLAADVSALDRAAVAAGVGVLQLMEIAGLQVARAVWRRLDHRPGRVFVVAGRGNNGGDGLVAARLLDSWGCEVRCAVVATDQGRLGETVVHQLRALTALGVDVEVGAHPDRIREQARAGDISVDALLGTGLRGRPRVADAAAIEALCEGAPVVAVDVPSGLDASSGEAEGACVTASMTVTLTAMKMGLWLGQGPDRAGEVWVADIGMPAVTWRLTGLERPTAVTGGELLRVPAITP